MQRRATLNALAAIALWGTLAVLVLKLKQVPPFFLVGVALLVGSVTSGRRPTLRGMRPGVLLLGVYGLFAYHFCLFLGLRLAPPIEANLINYLWPLLIVVLSPLIIPGTRLQLRHIAGASMGFAGAALLVTGGKLGFFGSHVSGYLLTMAAAFIWSTYSLLTKRIAHFPTSAVATFCFVSGALSLVCHFVFEPAYVPGLAELPLLLVIGVGPMGAAFYFWDRAMKDGDPRTIGTLAYLTPLLSTLLITAFGEGHLTQVSLAAGAMIVSGAAIGSAPRRGALASAPGEV